MSKANSTVQIGPSGSMLLTITFVLLKVFGYISWSWWWVFSPLWISAIIVIVVLGIVLGLAIAAEFLK